MSAKNRCGTCVYYRRKVPRELRKLIRKPVNYGYCELNTTAVSAASNAPECYESREDKPRYDPGERMP